MTASRQQIRIWQKLYPQSEVRYQTLYWIKSWAWTIIGLSSGAGSVLLKTEGSPCPRDKGRVVISSVGSPFYDMANYTVTKQNKPSSRNPTWTPADRLHNMAIKLMVQLWSCLLWKAGFVLVAGLDKKRRKCFWSSTLSIACIFPSDMGFGCIFLVLPLDVGIPFIDQPSLSVLQTGCWLQQYLERV